jgi:simple sugar transport system permease protein
MTKHATQAAGPPVTSGESSQANKAAAPRTGTTSSRSGWSPARLLFRPEAGALVGTVGMFVFFAIFGGQEFLATGGIASWLNVAAELGIIALAVGLLMIAGELDLSVGSVVAGSSVTCAIVSGHYGAPTWVGVLAGLTLGLVTGFVNGLIVAKTKVASFVVTLATNFGLVGLALGLSRVMTGSTSVSIQPDAFFKDILGHLIGGKFEIGIVWWLAIALLVTWVLQFTKYGNWILAVGGDLDSARTTGIPVSRVKISLFVFSGLAAALVGVMQTMLYNGAQVTAGQSFVFNSIIAVVIGGVLLTGGYGSALGIVLGTFTLAIVSQGIYYTGWNSDWASLILGLLLLAAVLANNTFRKLALADRRPARTKKG